MNIPLPANDRTNIITMPIPDFVTGDVSYIDAYVSSCIISLNDIVPACSQKYKPLLFLVDGSEKD